MPFLEKTDATNVSINNTSAHCNHWKVLQATRRQSACARVGRWSDLQGCVHQSAVGSVSIRVEVSRGTAPRADRRRTESGHGHYLARVSQADRRTHGKRRSRASCLPRVGGRAAKLRMPNAMNSRRFKVWSDSPEVPNVLGWGAMQIDLRSWLQSEEFLEPNEVKPKQTERGARKCSSASTQASIVITVIRAR